MNKSLLLLLGLSLSLGSTGCSLTPSPRASVAGDIYSAEAVRADFEQLYETLQVAHFDLYANLPKAEYDRYYRAYSDTLTAPMSRLEVAKRFQQFVALGRVAHARIDFPMESYVAYREAGGKTLPLYLVVRGGRAFVEEGYEPLAPFDEVTAVDGEPILDWLHRVGQHVSADTPELAHTLLESQLPGILWLEDGERESYEVTIRDEAGSERTVTVPTTTADELQALREAAAARDTSDADDTDSSETVDWTQREARMLDDRVAYLRPGPFYNHLEGGENLWDTTEFHGFVDRAFRKFAAAKAQALILDLRNNPGGTNSFSDHLLAYFADEPFRFASDFRVKISPQAVAANEARLVDSADEDDFSHRYRDFYARHQAGDVASFELPYAEPGERRFDGQVYALVNRHSYSNAVSVAAIVQDYRLGRIVGEATADLATTYGAMESFTLDHTGLVVGFPKAHIIRPNGDTRPAGVTPDVRIEAPFGAGEAAAVLDAAVEIVRRDLTEEIQ